MHPSTSSPVVGATYYREDASNSVRNQYIAAIIVSLGVFCYGSAVGWVSPSMDQLQGETSPLGASLTPSEVAAVASLFCVGGLAGSLASGVLVDSLGRKWTGLIIAVPYVVCWILKLTASSVSVLYVARVFAGAGGGGSILLSPLYSLEIGSLSVRGALGSLAMLALNAGILFAFIIGSYLPYTTVLWIHLSVPVVYFIGFYFMPETPTFLVKTGKHEEAAKAIAWLRNTSTEDPVTDGVLSNLKEEVKLASKDKEPSVKDIEFINEHGDGDQKYEAIEPKKDVPDWKFFVTSKVTMKAFAMCFVLMTVQGYVGIFAVVSFVSEIFSAAGSTLSPSSASIVVGSLQLAGSYVSILLVERLGRKILFIASSTVLGLGMFTLGTYFYFKVHGYDMSSVGWIPVTALSIGIFMDATGVGPIPFVIANEVFMVQAHGIAITILSIWFWVNQFVQTQFYKAAEDAIGSEGIFWGFSAVAIFGSLFTTFLVPETKGKSLEEILQHFDSKLKKEEVGDEFEDGRLDDLGHTLI